MKNHGIAERVTDMGDRARERLVHTRMEKLDRDNERLRTEVSLLRGDLDAERSSLKDALKGLEARKVTVKESRRPHLIRALVIAGAHTCWAPGMDTSATTRSSRKHGRCPTASKLRSKELDGDGWESSKPDGGAITPPASGSS